MASYRENLDEPAQLIQPLCSSWEDARDLLREWREENLRNSEQVVEVGDFLMQRGLARKLGDEVWPAYEQIFLAALECGRLELAQVCYKQLRRQFPGSLRVAKLEAMRYEFLQKYDVAEQKYHKILEEDEANSAVHKRLIAIHKAQGKIPEAIKELNKYLERFMSDHEAWLELANLYIVEMEYGKAAFCLEELIMANPQCHLYHQRYAEVRYTQGGTENMELARKYFAQAAKLNPTSIRALFGLFLAASHLAAQQKGGGTKSSKTENKKYAAWAAKQIQERYEALGQREDSQIKALTATLDSLELS
ncbi:ER membrane protein complex subunit 2-like [Branchiostoma floridae x Branchiostoma japonicum]